MRRVVAAVVGVLTLAVGSVAYADVPPLPPDLPDSPPDGGGPPDGGPPGGFPIPIDPEDPLAVCFGVQDQFADDAGLLYERSIDCLYNYNLIEGYNETEFRPDVLLLRQHSATMLVNFVEQSGGADLPVIASGFTDIAGTTHEENINKGFAAGIIKGFADSTFRPQLNVTREQFVSLLVQAAESLGGVFQTDGTDTFSDDNGSVHESNIEKAHDERILVGIPVQDTSFMTQANVTRGEAAHMMANVLRQVLPPEPDFPPPPEPDLPPPPS